MLEIEPESSERTARALKNWAISPAPIIYFLKHYFMYAYMHVSHEVYVEIRVLSSWDVDPRDQRGHQAAGALTS